MKTRSTNRTRRLTILAIIALAALYFLPRMIRGGLEGYRKGAEIRQQQGR
jgi:hypothetical protein